MPVELKCITCSRPFLVPPVRAATAKACSRACKSAMLREQYREEWHEKPCAHCGVTFKFPDWQARHQVRTYCSEPCKWAAESKDWAVREKSGKGAERVRTDGYLETHFPTHPFSGGKYVLSHRIVMEEWIREAGAASQFMVERDGALYLAPSIEVHHRDENKANNDRANLVACTRAAHRAMHAGKPVNSNEAWPLTGLAVIYQSHPGSDPIPQEKPSCP